MSALELAHAAHHEAMDLAEDAYLKALRGDKDAAKDKYREALERERRAAEALRYDFEIEPTRSVLYRSAATLAMRCDELREAERLSAAGLAGNPPEEIADELRHILDEVNFARHLRATNTLLANSVQLSLWGNAVNGGGVIAGAEFSSRYQDTERLLQRTAARRTGRPYEDALPDSWKFKEQFSVYLSPPREASFAVTMTLGMPDRVLPGMEEFSPGAVIIDEFLECITLFNARQDEELGSRIGEPAYVANFMALARRIAPDGERIKGVGFTTLRGEKEEAVTLTRKRTEAPAIAMPPKVSKQRGAAKAGRPVRIDGVLRFADSVSAQESVKIVDRNGKAYRVIVPKGLMDDIVRPHWGQSVSLIGRSSGKRIELENILPEEEGAHNESDLEGEGSQGPP